MPKIKTGSIAQRQTKGIKPNKAAIALNPCKSKRSLYIPTARTPHP